MQDIIGQTDFTPGNVKQQIRLWESELNCIVALPGLMIEFEDSIKVKKFIEYANKKRIKIHSITDTERTHLIVVDINNEKESYDFLN